MKVPYFGLRTKFILFVIGRSSSNLNGVICKGMKKIQNIGLKWAEIREAALQIVLDDIYLIIFLNKDDCCSFSSSY